jgi:hypothetical protein
LLGGEAGGRSLGFLLHRINLPIAVSGGFLLAKKTASERHLMCPGGNDDQLVRLANGGRLVDGGRHRQHDLLFAGGTPNRIAKATSSAGRFGRAFVPESDAARAAPG